MKTIFLQSVLAFGMAYLGCAQPLTPIAAWDFFGQASPATSTATIFNSNLSSSNKITRGAGAAPSNANNSFRTTGFQNNGIAITNTDYFEITLGAAPGFIVSLSTIDARFNGTGSFYASPGVTSQFAYSLGGSDFILIGNPVTSTSLTMTQIGLTSIPDLQNVISGTIITIRYYASGQTTTGGWGFYSASAGSFGLSVGGSVNVAQTIPANTYIWNQTGTGNWTISSNWTPERAIAQANDILLFNTAGTCIITGVPSQTIAQLILSNNTNIGLKSSEASVLTIRGGTGTDLEVPAGCALNLNGENAISIAVASGATGTIGGNIIFSSTQPTAHSLTAADPGSMTFIYGAAFTAGTFSSGNPYGSSSSESIIFTNGSTFIHQAGEGPFGTSQQNSSVVFQTGSLYKVIANVPVSFSGRTYANFELDAAGAALSTEGEYPVTMDNLTVTGGTFNFNLTGSPGHSIKGNIYVATGGILNFAPAQAGTVTLNGICTQAISGTGEIGGTLNSTIEIANSDGVALNMNLSTKGNLKLTNGFLILGSNDLFLGTSSTITGNPSVSAMIVATGTGQVKKEFSTPASFTYPVGDLTTTAEYSPVTLNITSGIFEPGNYAGVNLINAKYPTDPNNGNYLNRYWSINSTGITDFSCNALFQYVPADITGTESQIYCVRVDPVPFTTFDITDTTLHLLTASGFTSFGAFTGTEAVTYVYDVSGTGSYCQGTAGLPVILSGSQFNVAYQLRKNGLDFGAPVAGTGLPLTWVDQLAGSYTVVGINSLGNTMMNGSAIIEEIPSAVAGVSIFANADSVCEGTLVTFTANPLNGGQAPSYQWKVNSLNAGTDNAQFSYIPVNGDTVSCIMMSSHECVTGNPAISNTLTITVSPGLLVSLIISPSANPVCPNTPVTFTATSLNGGDNPQYQWKVNGVNVGANARTYNYNLLNNDAVTCIMTSSLVCIPENPVISNTVNMIVNEIMPVSVSIVATANPVSIGTSVTFTATPVNGGTNPAYQWKVNGINVGTSSPLYTYVPANNDLVTCILTSNFPCVSCNPAISGTLIMRVNGGVIGRPTFVVYPNPTKGEFILEQKGGKEYGKIKVELVGIHGERIMTAELTGEKKHRFSLSDAPPGLYFLRVFTGETVETIKINKH